MTIRTQIRPLSSLGLLRSRLDGDWSRVDGVVERLPFFLYSSVRFDFFVIHQLLK